MTAPDRRIFAMSAAEPVSGATSLTSPGPPVGAFVASRVEEGVAFVASSLTVRETEGVFEAVAFAGVEDAAVASGASAGADRRRMT